MREKERKSKFEKIFNYSVCGIITLLGFLVLVGVFNVNQKIRMVFGWTVFIYGFVRFLLLRLRYKREKII